MSYDISVLVPAFHARRHIARAIRSIQRQKGPAIEIVIGADDDVDYLALLSSQAIDTADIVQCRTDRPQRGPGAARNVALRRASAPLIATLDADDEYEEGRLPALMGAASASGVATGPTVEMIAGTVTRTAGSTRLRDQLTVEDICGPRMPFFPVFRRELAGAGWPLMRHAEDMMFNVALLVAAGRYAFVNGANYRYHNRKGSLSNSAKSLRTAERSYLEILSALEESDWPASIRETVRTIILEDLATVRSGLGSDSGTWRETIARHVK